MNNDLISVIIPVYNAERYLVKSIRSILNQTYKNLEVIIINDGSTDSSRLIIKNIHDERIRFFERSHQGLISQLNFGLSAASGNFIARMDADDIGDLDRLNIQMAFLKNNPGIQLVSTNYSHIDQNGKTLFNKELPENHGDIEYMMPILNSICHAGMLTYKTAMFNSGAYSEKYLFVEDQDLFLRMISSGIKMHNIQKFLYSYRYEKKKLSRANREILLKNRYQLGSEYLNKYYKDSKTENYDYNFRYGLVEYYSGNIDSARKYFLRALGIKHANKKSLYRFLAPSLLGDPIMKFLRNHNILSGMSDIMNKFGRDYHMVAKNEK